MSYKKQSHKKKSISFNPFILFAVMAVLFLFLSLWVRVLILEGKIFAPEIKTPAPTPIERVEIEILENDATLGDSDAPVVVVEFSDFQCPYCGAVEGTNKRSIKYLKEQGYWKETDEPSIPKIIKDYVDKGLVYYIYKDMPLLGFESYDTAAAARCAGEQGKYWEYHDVLFELQNNNNLNKYSFDSLKQYGADLGLDVESFNECIDSERYLLSVKENKEEGKVLGIDGTPAMFVNGIRVPGGANPYSTIKSYIEAELQNNK